MIVRLLIEASKSNRILGDYVMKCKFKFMAFLTATDEIKVNVVLESFKHFLHIRK